jgi:hypothetical protein
MAMLDDGLHCVIHLFFQDHRFVQSGQFRTLTASLHPSSDGFPVYLAQAFTFWAGLSGQCHRTILRHWYAIISPDRILGPVALPLSCGP